MKKSLLMIAAALLFAAPAMAGISNTKHNLGSSGPGTTWKTTGTSEICIFCHTPHNANSTGPLWNRATNAVTSTYESPTLNNKVVSAYLSSNEAVAPLCLSCHDGSIAVGAVTNAFGKSMDVVAITGSAMLGSTLSNDHPVGMTYDASVDLSPYGDSGLRTTTTATTTVPSAGPYYRWFRTGTNYTNMMDCSSCHDVHGKDNNPKFLRRSNGSSNFCLTCHIK